MSSLQGRVRSVVEDSVGTSLTAAVAAGASSLPVNNATEFARRAGGTLLVGDQVVGYAGADVVTNVVTLTSPLTTAVDEGDEVLLYDPVTAAVAVEKTAWVDADTGSGDLLHVVVPHHMMDALPEGSRESAGEAVIVEADGDQWRLVNVVGQNLERDGRYVWNPYARCYLPAAITISNSTWTGPTSWATVFADGATTDASGITIVNPGIYMIMGQVAFLSNSSGRRRLRITVNGAQVGYNNVAAEDAGVTYVPVSTLVQLNEGDVVAMELYQTSGAGLQVSSGITISWFLLFRVSI